MKKYIYKKDRSKYREATKSIYKAEGMDPREYVHGKVKKKKPYYENVLCGICKQWKRDRSKDNV